MKPKMTKDLAEALRVWAADAEGMYYDEVEATPGVVLLNAYNNAMFKELNARNNSRVKEEIHKLETEKATPRPAWKNHELCMDELDKVHRERTGQNIRSSQIRSLLTYLVDKGLVVPDE